MSADKALTPYIVVSGDREIAQFLDENAEVNYPAFACTYDGFVNDIFTEYTNPSIYRPVSVRTAQLSSELFVRFFKNSPLESSAQPKGDDKAYPFLDPRPLRQPGNYYIGWTMYDQHGIDENVTVWLGDREIARVQGNANDNRVHLYVLTEPFFIAFGERLRIRTDANAGQYRFENVFLLRSLPAVSQSELYFSAISAELIRTSAHKEVVRLNWRSSRPMQCELHYGNGSNTGKITEVDPLANHYVDLLDLDIQQETWFQISGQTPAGQKAESERLRLSDFLPENGGVTQSGTIPFSVTNQLDVPAESWPVTWGFPFPRSALRDLAQCRLVGADGVPIPAQKRVKVSWDDGSIRWALFDFQINLPPLGTAELRLEYGPQIKSSTPTAGIKIVQNAGGLVVDAGLLRLTFQQEGYTFPAQIERKTADGYRLLVNQQDGLGGIVLVDEAGLQFDVNDGIEAIELEDAGPLRATIRVAVRHRTRDGQSLFRSLVRVTAYYNQPFVRVQHTFENDNVQSLFTNIRSLTLNLRIDAGYLGEVQFGDTWHPIAGKTVGLFQPLVDQFEVKQDGRVLAMGVHAPNWIGVRGATGAIALTMRDFWENYPKGWQADPTGIHIGICPDISTVTYPSETLDEVRSYFYLQNNLYKFKVGMARTHDMLVIASEDSILPTSSIALFSTPPLVRVAATLYEEMGVLSAVCPRDTRGCEAYDEWTDNALVLYEENRKETTAYGLLNFGDWYGERRYNWGNMEYDTPYAFLLEYLRGGNARYFTLGWQAAWHLVDVDTSHYHTDPNKVGRQYTHSLGHVGHYYPEGFLPGAIERESMSWTHTWVEGLYLYGLLTGESRLLDTATRSMEILAAGDLNNYDFTNCRDCGWPLRHLIGAYQATGQKRFLNGASIIVERVLERQRPTGGWERLMTVGHCYHIPPRHMGNAGFMVGVLLAALKRYHMETKDSAVGKAIVDASRYLVANLWEPEHGAFRYTSCPDSTIAAELNSQILEGLGYAWQLSKDERLREVLLAGLDACLTTPYNSTTPPVGKDISSRMRSMPFIMNDVVKALAESALLKDRSA